MPIDPNIALSLKPIQLANPLDQYLQAQQIQQAQGQNRLADLVYGEKQRGIAGENKLSQLLAAGGAPDQVAADLARSGFGNQALAYTKQQQEIAKSKADVGHIDAQTGKLKSESGKIDYEQREAKRQKAITDIAGFTSGDQALASLDLHEKAGDLTPEAAAAVRATIPQSPADFPKWQIGMLQRIMSAKDAMSQLAPDANTVANNKTSTANTAATNATSRANNAATVAATLNGQKLTDARSRDLLEEGKTQIVQSDNGPVLVNKRTGSGQAVLGPDGQPLAGVTKPLNDSQSKALLFGTRMQEADKILATLAKEGTSTSIPGSRAPLVGGAINALGGENHQMLDQAKRDFINATLRRESGAAISDSEFANGEKQYFPQIGEGPKVIAQKAANRKLAMRGVLAEVPEKQRNSITPANPGVPDDIAALLQKHGGK